MNDKFSQRVGSRGRLGALDILIDEVLPRAMAPSVSHTHHLRRPQISPNTQPAPFSGNVFPCSIATYKNLSKTKNKNKKKLSQYPKPN